MKNRFLITKVIWNTLPSFVQIGISKIYAKIYNTNLSRYFIKPFCFMNGLNQNYLSLFQSERSQNSNYKTFQDFFCRQLTVPIEVKHELIWPCEGFICEQNHVKNLPAIDIKGEKRTLKKIFSAQMDLVPDNYFYTNIFLHNQNYHRVHSPITGIITRIEKIAGDLSILRPWFYSAEEISKPALRNERVNIDITDPNGRIWFLSIVGGMAVGTIDLLKNTCLNQKIICGEELALFRLGSTVCMATPIELNKEPYLKKVFVGEPVTVLTSNHSEF